MFENDPGRKDRNLVGRRHLRNILSLVQVSREVYLVWLGKSSEESYWTLVTKNGRLRPLSKDLQQKLSELTQTENEPKVQSLILQGQVCKLLITSIDSHKKERKASVLYLSPNADLLATKEYQPVIENNGNVNHVLMNQRGRILCVCVQKSAESSNPKEWTVDQQPWSKP